METTFLLFATYIEAGLFFALPLALWILSLTKSRFCCQQLALRRGSMSCLSSFGMRSFEIRLHLYLIDLRSMLLRFKYEDLLGIEAFFVEQIYFESVCSMPIVGVVSDRDQLH
jgi:hypothetical protein